MDAPVLVLNANFEPLNVCSTRRAVGLLVAGRAEMLVNGRGYVRTVRLTYPRPSIIRLGHMVKRPRPRVRLTKREIFRRDGFACQYCGARAHRLTIDHVVPRYRRRGPNVVQPGYGLRRLQPAQRRPVTTGSAHGAAPPGARTARFGQLSVRWPSAREPGLAPLPRRLVDPSPPGRC